MENRKDLDLRDYLMDYIYSKDRQIKDKMPSENELAKTFNLSRHRVRMAYKNLEERGLIKSKQGMGWFISGQRLVINLPMTGESFTKKITRQGLDLVTKNMGITQISGLAALGENTNGKVYRIARLRVINGLPAAIHFSYVSDQIFPEISKEGASIRSMSDYCSSKGFKDLSYSKSVLTIEFPTRQMMDLLDSTSLIPLLVLESRAKNLEGKTIEIIKTYYRSDLFKYELN